MNIIFPQLATVAAVILWVLWLTMGSCWFTWKLNLPKDIVFV